MEGLRVFYKKHSGGIWFLVVVIGLVLLAITPRPADESLKAMWDKLTPAQQQEVIDEYIANHSDPWDYSYYSRGN